MELVEPVELVVPELHTQLGANVAIPLAMRHNRIASVFCPIPLNPLGTTSLQKQMFAKQKHSFGTTCPACACPGPPVKGTPTTGIVPCRACAARGGAADDDAADDDAPGRRRAAGCAGGAGVCEEEAGLRMVVVASNYFIDLGKEICIIFEHF